MVRITLIAVPIETGNNHDFVHNPINTLLLRFIHELASHKICLFDAHSKESFRSDLFPYDQEEEMPVYDLQVSMDGTRNDYLSVSPGFSALLKDPRHDWKIAGGQVPSCYVVRQATRGMHTRPVVDTVSDLPGWVKTLASKWTLSLKFSTRR